MHFICTFKCVIKATKGGKDKSRRIKYIAVSESVWPKIRALHDEMNLPKRCFEKKNQRPAWLGPNGL